MSVATTILKEDDFTEETMKVFCAYDGMQLLEPEVTQFRGKCSCPICGRQYSVYINRKSKEISVKEITKGLTIEQQRAQMMRMRAYSTRFTN